jgi:hypothetical protein
MDLLRRHISWLVRFPVDCATLADRLGRVLWISHARRSLDRNHRAGCEVHFARRCNEPPPLDDSQFRSDSCGHLSTHVLASYFCVPLAFFDGLPRHRLALLDPELDRRRGVPALRANAYHDSASQPWRQFATAFVKCRECLSDHAWIHDEICRTQGRQRPTRVSLGLAKKKRPAVNPAGR